MPRTYWMGPHAPHGYKEPAVGITGFIVEVANLDTGASRFELRDHPVTRERTLEPTLYGRTEAINNRRYGAHGMGRIVRVARNERYLVEELSGADEAAALEELGYPDL